MAPPKVVVPRPFYLEHYVSLRRIRMVGLVIALACVTIEIAAGLLHLTQVLSYLATMQIVLICVLFGLFGVMLFYLASAEIRDMRNKIKERITTGWEDEDVC